MAHLLHFAAIRLPSNTRLSDVTPAGLQYALDICWTNGPLRLLLFELHDAPGKWQTEHVVLNLVLCNQIFLPETICCIPVISIH